MTNIHRYRVEDRGDSLAERRLRKIVYEECIGGCEKVGPVPPGHPALIGYLCPACAARVLETFEIAEKLDEA